MAEFVFIVDLDFTLNGVWVTLKTWMVEFARSVIPDCLFHMLTFSENYRTIFGDQYVFFKTTGLRQSRMSRKCFNREIHILLN